MLKKENRLKKRYQFAYVYKAGEHFSSKNLVLYLCPSKTKNIKIGFSVTKKIGHAFERNLIKRRLREVVQKMIPCLKQNLNIIVVAKPEVVNANFVDLQKEFSFLCKQANIVLDEKII